MSDVSLSGESPHPPGPILAAEVDRVLTQFVTCSLFAVGDDSVARWLCSLDFAERSTLTAIERRSRSRRSSVRRIETLVARGGGLSLIPDPVEATGETPLVDHLVVSQRRKADIRSISAFLATPVGLKPRQRFERCTEFYRAAIDYLGPIYAYLQFGTAGSTLLYGSRLEEPLPVTFTGYFWRNYLTPDLVGSLTLGDGSSVDAPRHVDFGATPLVSLKERDRVYRLLAPLLPARRTNPIEFGELHAARLQFASVDGGIETPDIYMSL